MVENTGKSGEQIQWEFRTKDNEDWFDVVSVLDGSFVEPSWIEGYQYRLKIVPEVVKPKWPETTMTETELEEVYYYDAPGYNHTVIANAAIAHALETGLVVLPEVVSKTQQINYKKDIEDWGSNALNEAAREFISKQDKHYVLSCSGAVGIKAAILRYLECVEREAL